MRSSHFNFLFLFCFFLVSFHSMSASAASADMDSLSLIVLPPTIVSGKAIEEEQGKIHLSTVEARRYPAPANDPIRFLKVLPGISSGNDFSSSYNASGGNYDQNLLYINGIEIESPFQVRHGLAQSISMVNPAMIDSMAFRSISFPVMMGDRLSSLVEADYKTGTGKMEGEVDVGLSAQSIVVRGSLAESVSFSSGARHANLGRYAQGLQITGEFVPSFWDWQTQIKAESSLLGDLSLFAATLNSSFVMRPEKIRLRYNCSLLRHQEVCSELKGLGRGAEKFEYADRVVGVSMERGFSSGTVKAYAHLTRKREIETTDVGYSIAPGNILSKEEFNSKLRRDKVESAIVGTKTVGRSHLLGGAGLRLSTIDGRVNSTEEITYRRGSFLNSRNSQNVNRKDADPFFFLQNSWASDRFSMIMGIRFVRFGATGETIEMPRISMSLKTTPRLALTLAAGRHAQPPIYKEYLGGRSGEEGKLKAQRSDQIGAGLVYEIQDSLHWSCDIFYRHQWRMISYHIDDLRIFYSDSNDSKGFVYGVNSKLRGKMDSLIGIASYGYLVAREDILGDDRGYLPRPSDQRHTASLYVEDRMYLDILPSGFIKYSRFHLSILYGTGFPYTSKIVQAGKLIDGPRNDRRDRPYFRFDVGLTQGLNLLGRTFHLRQEIANLFDQYNVLGYSYFPTFLGESIEVRRSLGRRVYNLGIALKFQ